MTLNRSLFFALGFVLILSLILRLESELVRDERADIDVTLHTIQLNERIRQEANVYSLLQRTFGRFREMLSTNYKTVFRYSWPPDFIKKNLPPNLLSVALVDNHGSLIESVNLSEEKIDPEFFAKFVYIDYSRTKEYKEDILFNPKYHEMIEQSDKLLADIIGAPCDRVAMMQMRAGRLTTFRSAHKLIGIYWDRVTVSPEHKVYFFCRLDLHEMPLKHVYQSLVDSEISEGYAVAFYHVKNQRFLAGDGQPLVKTPAEKKFFKKVCGDYVTTHLNKGVVRSGSFRKGNLLVVVGREIIGTGLLPVVATKFVNTRKSSVRPASLAFFALLCLALLLFVQTSVFSRGLRLNVGKVLIIASLLAIFMPFLMGRSIFQLILRETSKSERLKMERSLYSTLGNLDAGMRLYNANLLQSFIHSFAHPDTIESLELARQEQALYESSKSDDFDQARLHKADTEIMNIADRAFAPFKRDLKLDSDPERRANAILIMGPKNFLRYYDRFKRTVVGHHKDSRNESMFMLLNLYRRTLEKFFPSEEYVPGLRETGMSNRAVEMEKVIYDEIKSQLLNSLGRERFYEVFSRLDGLNSIRTSVGSTYFTVFPMRVRGLIEYFCGIGWDEYSIGESYLKTAFANIVNVEAEPPEVTSIFDLLDPVNLIRASPALVQVYAGFRSESLCSGSTESGRLSLMLRSASRSRKVIRQAGTGNDQAIYQALPGRYLSLYTVSGRQDTSHLDRIEFWRHSIFMTGMLLFVIFAVLAAVNISRSFTGPLEHLLWGLNSIESGNYEIRLKDSREDEFGSISRTFNRMVKGLRERNALGNFVSDSVRRLAGNPELFEKAREGSEAKYTILFADFEGFSKFATEAGEQEVHQKLEFSLDKFFRYASEYGGEVDKVIGEKLLIVFSHERLGKKSAAVAAIKLARRIIADFKTDRQIKPVFGINSGRVISGIIGTPEVRVDNTVIGDPVNVAARMCSLANSESMPIIISGAIKSCLSASYKIRPVAIEKIRGKKQEVEVFSLVV